MPVKCSFEIESIFLLLRVTFLMDFRYWRLFLRLFFAFSFRWFYIGVVQFLHEVLEKSEFTFQKKLNLPNEEAE